MTITINEKTYTVGIASVARSVRKAYKYQVTTEDGVEHSELRATYLDFSLSLGNVEKTEYDRLMRELTQNGSAVTVTLPRDYNSTETYTGAFENISDAVLTEDGEGTLWDNLSLSFTGTVPLEVSG